MEWISVKDKLPEKYAWVLLYAHPFFNQKKFHVGYLDNHSLDNPLFVVGAEPEDYYGDQQTYDVSHWMPLPEPPGLENGMD